MQAAWNFFRPGGLAGQFSLSCTFLGDAAHDHGPEGDGEAVPRLAIVVLLQSQELVNVEEDPEMKCSRAKILCFLQSLHISNCLYHNLNSKEGSKAPHRSHAADTGK